MDMGILVSNQNASNIQKKVSLEIIYRLTLLNVERDFF